MWQPHALAMISWTSKLLKLILPSIDLQVQSSLPRTVVTPTLSRPAQKDRIVTTISDPLFHMYNTLKIPIKLSQNLTCKIRCEMGYL